MPLAVFYSYSHKDEQLRQQLETHLALLERNGLILPWHDRCIGAGDEWARQIDEHLHSAQIILLLVSPDFLASRYCFDVEMQAALERHAGHKAIVIPIILRPCDWSGAPFAHLQALPRDAKAVDLWPNRDEAFAEIAKSIHQTVVRFQQPLPQPPRLADLVDQATPKPRLLDAAMPSHIMKDRATELLVLIRLPESKGLAGILQADDEAEARPEDVRSKPFEVTFSQGPTGAFQPLKVSVELTSPDFSPPAQRKNIFVPVNTDSEVCPFLLTPARTGSLMVTIELIWEDAERGYRRLRTNCVSESELPAAKPVMNIVQLPLGISQQEGSAPAPHTLPAPLLPARAKPSFLSSPALKVAAIAIFALTTGTFFLQQHTAVPINRDSAGPPVESANTNVSTSVAIESAAVEFRKVSKPAPGPLAVKPAVAAAIESGQTNLAAARIALAKGNKKQAEAHLKLVRIATERLKKN